MTCCNHNCNQGRNCPARTAAAAQAVAQARAKPYVKHDGTDPLRGPAWRRGSRTGARVVLVIGAACVGFVATLAAFRLFAGAV